MEEAANLLGDPFLSNITGLHYLYFPKERGDMYTSEQLGETELLKGRS